ncbi:MAG: LysR family transcriptional regulator [Pigmentiphaga sp.]
MVIVTLGYHPRWVAVRLIGDSGFGAHDGPRIDNRLEKEIDIRELRTFVCIARVGSFSRAATELYVAQPALSRQIAKLEDELGQSLFVRYGRGIRLTDAGHRLLERAETILAYVEETREHVRSVEEGLSGQISVGFSPTVGNQIAGTVINNFRARMPGVSLRLREGLSHTQQEWLTDGRIDVGVIQNQPATESFDVLPIFSEPMVLVGPIDSVSAGRLTPLPDKSTLRIRDLSNVPLIMPGPPHTNRRLFEQLFAQHGCRLLVQYEVDSMTVCRNLVLDGFGYAIMTRTSILDELTRGDIRAVMIDNPSIRTVVCIATLREKRSSNLVKLAADVVKSSIHEVLKSGPWHEYMQWLDDS